MKGILNFILPAVMLLCTCVAVHGSPATSADDSLTLRPRVYGVFRGRYELQLSHGEGRFMVRNARLGLKGELNGYWSYNALVDLCDRGKFLFLDGWVKFNASDDLGFKAGQYRMPFGTDNFRAPGSYVFADRSFMARNVNNYRAVGVSVEWTPQELPVSLQGGVFNPTTILDHTRWVKEYAYAARARSQWKNMSVAAGFQSVKPDSVRSNMWAVSVGWNPGPLQVEAEYLTRGYNHGFFKATQCWNVFADYRFKLSSPLFNVLSVQGRYDSMTAMPGDNPGRQRITVGSTLDKTFKGVRTAFRLNYEHMFHDRDVALPDGDNRLVAELVFRF